MQGLKTFLIYIMAITLTTANTAYAQLSPSEKEKIEIDEEIVEKEMEPYAYSLRQLIKEAEKRLESIDREIENKDREDLAREHFEKGNVLYKEGRLKEAKKEWQEALGITRRPEMKDYIRRNEKKSVIPFYVNKMWGLGTPEDLKNYLRNNQ